MSFELKKYSDGSRMLLVYYEGDAYDEAIEEAHRQVGSQADKLPVLAMPVKKNRPGRDPPGW